MTIFRKLYTLLDQRERRNASIVFLLMLITALFETIGVASIMPFVAVLSRPEIVENNAYLAALYARLGFVNPHQFMLVLGMSVLIFFVSSLVLRAATSYAVTRFADLRMHAISCRLLSAYLQQPYAFFLTNNTADLGKSILSEVGMVTNGVLLPFMKVLAAGITMLAIIVLLVVVDPFLSLMIASLMGGAYGLIFLVTRGLLNRIGSASVGVNTQRFVLSNEALNGIKALRLMGGEATYVNRFSKASLTFARHHAAQKMIGDLPSYAIQALVFGGLLGVVLYLMKRSEGFTAVLPLVSFYAFAGYRLLPAFQEVFRSSTQIRFHRSALDILHADLKEKESVVTPGARDIVRIPLRQGIRFEAVSFIYATADRPALSDFSIDIRPGTNVGFVGRTGAGKSTVVDLLLGLLEPTTGRILVDGEPLTGTRRIAWQRSLGYVPQSIFLSDDTVSANIAFGVPAAQILPEQVERAARAAHIHAFIVEGLPQGYQTVIGERGIRLSGGQRQRLAIARALYHDPDVIVFDEATSALDTGTEAAVLAAINDLRGHKTLVHISHRLSTVQHCDQLFVLDQGRLAGQGTYAELRQRNEVFRRLLHTTGEDVPIMNRLAS